MPGVPADINGLAGYQGQVVIAQSNDRRAADDEPVLRPTAVSLQA